MDNSPTLRLLYGAATVLFVGALVLTLTDNNLIGDLMFIAGGICVISAILVRRGYLR